MGLTSLILSIIGIVVFFALFMLLRIGIYVSAFFAVLGLVFGVVGIKKKENTGIAGTVLSIIIILTDLFFYVAIKG